MLRAQSVADQSTRKQMLVSTSNKAASAKNKPAFTLPENAPDLMVLSDAQICALANISSDTLRRLDQRGEGPEWVQLSPRRRGRTVDAYRRSLKQRANGAALIIWVFVSLLICMSRGQVVRHFVAEVDANLSQPSRLPVPGGITLRVASATAFKDQPVLHP